MKRTARDLLDAAARPHVPDDVNLLPSLVVRLHRRSMMETLRARPALAVVTGVLALGVLSGVAYAVGRSLGYIPGIGLVESGAGVRVLAQPVVVERDGITLTVTQGLVDSEKTVISYRVENIPEAAWRATSPKGQPRRRLAPPATGCGCRTARPSLRTAGRGPGGSSASSSATSSIRFRGT